MSAIFFNDNIKEKIFYYQIVVAFPLMDKVITCLAMIWIASINSVT